MKLFFLVLGIIYCTSNVYGKNYSHLNFESIDINEIRSRESIVYGSKKASLANSTQTIVRKINEAVSSTRLINNETDRELDEWYSEHEEFQHEYDELVLLKQAFIIEKLWQKYSIFRAAHTHHSTKGEAYHNELVALYTKWSSNKYFMGGLNKEESDLHRSRHLSYHKILNRMDKYFSKFRKSNPSYYRMYEDDRFNENKKSAGSWTGIGKLGIYTYDALGLFGNAALLLPDFAFQGKSGFFKKPFSKKINNLFKLYGQYSGVTSQISNIEKLPEFKDPSSQHVYLILPLHQLALEDIFMLTQLGLPKYLLCANPKEVSKTFAKTIADHPQFISTGLRGANNRSSVEQIDHALKTQNANVIVNFPQGHLEVEHVMPLNGSFDNNLVRHLVGKDKKLHIVPMHSHFPSTFPVSGLGLPKEFPLSNFNGDILDELGPDTLNYLLDKEFPSSEWLNQKAYPQLISMIIRSLWIENKSTFEDLSIDQMSYRIEEMYKDCE